MKTPMRILLLCLLLTACTQPEKNAPKEAPPGPSTPVNQFSEEEKTWARALSNLYDAWSAERAMPWPESDAHARDLAQAYVFGMNSRRYLGPARIESLSMVLQKFKTTTDTAPGSREMLLLARAYLEKEKSL